jgi:cytochrome c553
MKNICMIVIVALLVVVPLSLWSQDAPNGAELFKSNCTACHGDKGEGKPDINMPAVKGTSMDVEKLVKYLTKGESGKTIHSGPVGDLNAEQAKAVAEYIKKL